MADLKQSRRWQQRESASATPASVGSPQWESSDSREDHQAVLPLHRSRRKSAPKDEVDAMALHDKAKERKMSSKPKRRDSRNPSRQRYIRKPKPDPEAFQAAAEESANKPQHHYTQASGQSSLEQTTPRTTSLKEGKHMLLQLLQQQKNEFTADGSTASTSGSNSSSSSSDTCLTKASKSGIASVSMDSDKELELYSRKIRIELRQAEMKELAEEAERAAASGQKSFAGRASFFGNEESELEIELDGIQSKITPSSHGKIRRSLDFGTPLVRRLTLDGTPLVRRLNLEPTKISVKALRDMAEVVPSFKDFHLHLRTHLLRRNVDKRTLVFEELGKSASGHSKTTHPSSPCQLPKLGVGLGESQHSDVIQLWNSINFGSWTSTSKRSLVDPEAPQQSTSLCDIGDFEANHPLLSSTGDLGEFIADHMLTPLRGARRKHVPRVQVPPGLTIVNKETFELQEQGPELALNHVQMYETTASRETVASPSTPTQPRPVGRGKDTHVSTSSKSTKGYQSPKSTDAYHFNIQDGSPNSPIVVDDLELPEDLTPGQKGIRHNQGSAPPPGLPLTPKENFQRVFDSSFVTPKDKRLQDLMATRGAYPDPVDPLPMDVNGRETGPDFVTPVRLRDIRDDHMFGPSAFSAGLPEAPFVRQHGSCSKILETPNSILEGHEELRYPRRRNHMEKYNVYEAIQEDPLPIRTSLMMRPTLDKVGHQANEALLDIGARAALYDAADPATVLPCLEDDQPFSENSIHSYSGASDDWQRCDESTRPATEARNRDAKETKVIALEDVYEEDQDQDQTNDQSQTRQNFSMPILSRGPPDDYMQDSTAIRRGVSYDAPVDLQARELFLEEVADPFNSFIQESPDRQQKSTDASNVIIEFKDIDNLETKEGSVSGDSKGAGQSKATADFQRCGECLISPASSLDSDDGFQASNRDRQSSWNIMERTTISPSNSNHQSLQAAVAMLSRISPTGDDGKRKNVVCVAPKDNDDFMSNYLYCSKTAAEAPLPPEPICSGSAPCQDTKMPCGEVAVDSCVGNFLETALRILPRKSHSSKFLSLSRDNGSELQSKPMSWYDLANEKFDRFLDRLVGSEHRQDDYSRLAFQAPSLKERKLPQHHYKTPPSTPPRSPPIHTEVYDEDLGGVVYLQSTSSVDMNASQVSYQSSHHSMQSFTSGPRTPRNAARRRDGAGRKLANLRLTLSDTAELNEAALLHHRYSM